jgi:hypothetical protein
MSVITWRRMASGRDEMATAVLLLPTTYLPG